MNKTLKTLSLFCLMGGSALAQNITGNYQIPKVPAWAENAVFYQIYPQTFCDSDGVGIGEPIRNWKSSMPSGLPCRERLILL